ncbi:hypothetical protein AMS68_007697 [Peltaster fructicola]|uniref:General stress protein FMN-binding split barrel domain-containing protein n=1 Tax=Peltaster fructicola TaxID=286661 RepID=A0A6H0Y6F0_9PEZI|nr:hypothetical protein AMS68_007697 [Peltaster fructicola]
MVQSLKKSEIKKEQDPSVAKQWDNDVPLEDKYNDFAAIADKIGICMFGSFRPGTGPVGRSMAVAKRSGPDFLFLANAHSQKFDDISENPMVALSFQNTSNQDWISLTGQVVKTTNDDPRIGELFNKSVSAWFGDLGDGVHTGKADDPRVTLIEVQAKYISYWKHTTTGSIGFVAEVVTASATGGVAQTGKLRQFESEEIQQLRSKHSSFTS